MRSFINTSVNYHEVQTNDNKVSKKFGYCLLILKNVPSHREESFSLLDLCNAIKSKC